VTVGGVGGACLSPPRPAPAMSAVGQSLGELLGVCRVLFASPAAVGGSFQCGGVPGSQRGLGLKAARGFVRGGGLARTSPEKRDRKVPCAASRPGHQHSRVPLHVWGCRGCSAGLGRCWKPTCAAEEIGAGGGVCNVLTWLLVFLNSASPSRKMT